VGLDSQLVWKHYGDPDEWDSISAVIPVNVSPENKEWRTVRGRDMFPYITHT